MALDIVAWNQCLILRKLIEVFLVKNRLAQTLRSPRNINRQNRYYVGPSDITAKMMCLQCPCSFSDSSSYCESDKARPINLHYHRVGTRCKATRCNMVRGICLAFLTSVIITVILVNYLACDNHIWLISIYFLNIS